MSRGQFEGELSVHGIGRGFRRLWGMILVGGFVERLVSQNEIVLTSFWFVSPYVM